MGNEKCEKVLKRAHTEETTPEKKRKIDDEGIIGDNFFKNIFLSLLCFWNYFINKNKT